MNSISIRRIKNGGTFRREVDKISVIVNHRVDYEQSIIFLRDSRVGERARKSRLLEVIFTRDCVLSHSTIPEKNEGLLVV